MGGGGGGGGGLVFTILFIKNLAHYSSHKNFELIIYKNKTNYSLKVRQVAKKSDYSLFIIFSSIH